MKRQHPHLGHQGLEAQGGGAGEVGVALDGGVHRVVERVGQALLGAPAVAVDLGLAVTVVPDPPLVVVGDQEERVLLAQAGGPEAEGLGAVGIDRREGRRVLLAVDKGQEDAAGQARLIEDVLQHAQVEVDPEVLLLLLEVRLVDGDCPAVRRSGLDRPLQLDLLGGVVREQQDQVVEFVAERLEAAHVSARGEGEMAPLVARGRAEPVGPMPHEHRPHRPSLDRRQEVERPRLELEPEDVPLQRHPLDRHHPAVRPRGAQGRIVGVRGREGGEGGQGEDQDRDQDVAGEAPEHGGTLRVRILSSKYTC
jgi:hypothetical protein